MDGVMFLNEWSRVFDKMDGVDFLMKESINETINLVNTTLAPVVEVDQYRANVIFAYGFFYTFCVPVIGVFGIITNILNIIVFSNTEMKDESYKYLKMNAFSNMFYLAIVTVSFSKRCLNFCELEAYLISNVYYWVFYIYLKGIPAVFTIFMQILVSFLRLQIVINKKLIKLPDYKITTVILLIIAAIYYSPNAFTKRIDTYENQEEVNGTITYTYKMVNNALGSSTTGKTLIIVTTFIRGFICAGIIITINVITKIKLTAHMNKKKKVKGGGQAGATAAATTTATTEGGDAEKGEKKEEKKPEKKKLSAEDKASKNLTEMVFVIAGLYIIGNMPNSCAWAIIQFVDRSGTWVLILVISANVFLFTIQGLDLFVYYRYNKKFRNILRKIFHLAEEK